MEPKAYYRNYLADNNKDELNYKLVDLIIAENPNSAFEFGCGTGKNLRFLPSVVCGLDISPQNIIKAHYSTELPFLILGDESHLGHLCNFDVVFTCSVLDHISDIDKIIEQFKRIGRTIFLAETNDTPGEFYYPHDYESYGFEKIENFSWVGEDGATYYIWKYEIQ